jgi:hypothetical protein
MILSSRTATKEKPRMGWDIVKHSFAMLWRNLGNALRISLGPLAVAVLLSLAIITVLQVSAARLAFELASGAISTNVAFAVLLLAFLYVVVSAWIAVSWHRFILLEEYPGLLPAFAGSPVLPYVGKTLLLGLALMAAMIPAVIVIALLSGVFGPTSGLLSVVGIGLALYFSYMWLRLGLVLPATAVGRPMGIGDSWRSTAPHANAILGTGALLILLNTGVSLVSSILPATLVLGLDVIVSWVTVMVGTSVLTTLYGVIVERVRQKRHRLVRRAPHRRVQGLDRRPHPQHRPRDIDVTDLLGPKVIFRHIGEPPERPHPARCRDMPAGLLINFAVQRPHRVLALVDPAAGQLQLRIGLALESQQKVPPARQDCVNPRPQPVLLTGPHRFAIPPDHASAPSALPCRPYMEALLRSRPVRSRAISGKTHDTRLPHRMGRYCPSVSA